MRKKKYFFGFILISIFATFYLVILSQIAISQSSRKISYSELKDYQQKRTKIWKWKRKEFLERIRGIKEPLPTSEKEAKALALNSVFDKNFKKVSYHRYTFNLVYEN